MTYSGTDGFLHGTFRAEDGLELAYQVREGGGGPTIVLTNGLGGSYKAWRPFVEYLSGDHRLITWDYRGLYRSDRPSDLDTLSVERQWRDMETLLNHLQVDQALLMGWSMGVQMNFEYYKHRPDRVLGIVAINGTSGLPFETALSVEVARKIVPAFVTCLKYSGPLLTPLMGRLGSKLLTLRAIQTLGLLDTGLSFSAWEPMAEEFATLNLHTYFETLRQLGHHDAREVLSTLSVPLLVVAGTRDILTPAWISNRMAAEVPDAELMLVHGATHFVPLEHPELLALRVEKFVRERLDQKTKRPRRSKKRPGAKHAPA